MSDWQVGDLAVRVTKGTWHCEDYGKPKDKAPSVGEACRVIAVRAHVDANYLELAEYPEGQWHAPNFRKIRPDEQEPCETEFVELLNRSKRKVSA